MAYSLSAGNNFAYAGAVLTALPFTFACWFNAAGLATHALVGFDDGTTANRFFLTKQAVGTLLAQAVAAGTASQATTTTTYSANVWNHGCAIFATSTDRRVYLNGGGKGTSAQARSPGAPTATRLGYLATPTLEFIGSLAECAIWNVALSDIEVAALAAGVLPLRIQPSALVGYWPLWGNFSPEIDLTVNNRQMTANGTPTKTNHAPVALFSPVILGPSMFTADIPVSPPPSPPAASHIQIIAPAVMGSMMIRR